MSLQVWLPLNGNLNNQGLSTQTANITSTPVWATTGKIGGKSLYTNVRQTTMHFPGLVGVSTYSVAYWLYIPTAIAPTAWADMFGIAFNCAGTTVWERDERRAATTTGRHNYHLAKSTSEGSNTNAYYGTREDDSANDNWVHYVLTKDNSSAKLYADGTLVVTVPAANFESTKRTMTGDVYFGDNGCEAYLNDFRIYNHCLSPMEVKELAKGLILHYPLNRNGWGQENLLKESHVAVSTTSYAMHDYYFVSGKAPVEGQTYTVQLKGQLGTGKTHFGLFNSGGSVSCVSLTPTTQQNGIYKATFTWKTSTSSTTASNTYLRVYHMASSTSATSTIEWIKLEEGSVATPWCPNSTDTNNMGLDSTIEYDCSGFCNNGTRIGTFTWTSDTPKYAVSTHIGATSSKIHISNFPTSGFGNSYSFAWWGKRSSNNPMFWGFSDGIRLNGMYNGNLWNTGDSSNNPIYKPGTTTTITGPSVNVWHHYVMTGDGTSCKLYVDGALYGQAKTYKAISGTSIYINGWDSGTSYCSDNTDISDFRIYATALSASDVKSLYQNCATIDPDGTIRGQIRI